MAKEKDTDRELSEMLRSVPPQNILISFDDKPARSLAELAEEQRKKDRQKKHKPRDDRER